MCRGDSQTPRVVPSLAHYTSNPSDSSAQAISGWDSLAASPNERQFINYDEAGQPSIFDDEVSPLYILDNGEIDEDDVAPSNTIRRIYQNEHGASPVVLAI
eukprot:TRINITY_DN1906_c0_g1_i1.p1 TRINITY_DN1906_c0_g1~~TRINITY_DN1906_c0_g1_i1.p1  ORF type:complete len:101 (+),score=18.04 TRINITY_DN1906_c0_g1_i1:181-483(+)